MSYPLSPYYREVFPHGNRNAAGAQWFHYIETNNLPQELHKAYCGVSGSVVDPSREPVTVRIRDGEGGGYVCGEYHLCCHPCACDVMRFTEAEAFGDKTVLSIPDPCAQPRTFRKKFRRSSARGQNTECASHRFGPRCDRRSA